MASFNKIILVGNLTRDPELRYTPSGAAVATLGIATNRRYTTSGGTVQEETCFVDVVAWQKQAETAAEYLKKGRLVLIEGRLTFRSWEGQDGGKHSKHEVVAERIQFLPSGNSNGSGNAGAPKTEADAQAGSEEVPF